MQLLESLDMGKSVEMAYVSDVAGFCAGMQKAYDKIYDEIAPVRKDAFANQSLPMG